MVSPYIHNSEVYDREKFANFVCYKNITVKMAQSDVHNFFGSNLNEFYCPKHECLHYVHKKQVRAFLSVAVSDLFIRLKESPVRDNDDRRYVREEYLKDLFENSELDVPRSDRENFLKGKKKVYSTVKKVRSKKQNSFKILTLNNINSSLMGRINISIFRENGSICISLHGSKFYLSQSDLERFYSCESKKLFVFSNDPVLIDFSDKYGMDVYTCIFCSGFHLGHKRKKGNRRRVLTLHGFMKRAMMKPDKLIHFLTNSINI